MWEVQHPKHPKCAPWILRLSTQLSWTLFRAFLCSNGQIHTKWYLGSLQFRKKMHDHCNMVTSQQAYCYLKHAYCFKYLWSSVVVKSSSIATVFVKRIYYNVYLSIYLCVSRAGVFVLVEHVQCVFMYFYSRDAFVGMNPEAFICAFDNTVRNGNSQLWCFDVWFIHANTCLF